MKIADYKQLYDFVMQDKNRHPWEAIRTIRRLRKMSNKLLKALWVLLEGGFPDVAVGDVTYAELVNDEGMSPIEALLILDWLERDPQAATVFMESERMRKPIAPLNEAETELVRQALRNLTGKEEFPAPETLEQLDQNEMGDIVTQEEPVETNSDQQ